MKRKLRTLVYPLVVTSLVFLSACGSTGTGANSKAVKVGAVLSLSGPNSPLGVPEKQAIEMRAKEINASGGINGKALEVIFEDDKSDNTEAVKAVKKLIGTDKVVAVLGSSGSGPSLAMADYAVHQKVPMISMAAADKITNPVRSGIYKTPHTDVHGTKRIYKFLKERGIKKVAILYDSNPYGSGYADQLNKYAPEYEITIVGDEKYGTKDPSMSTQLTKLKGTDAQALIVAGTNPGPSTIVKEAKQLGITIPIISSHGSANEKFIELAGNAANGVFMVAGKLLVPDQVDAADSQSSIIKKFVKDYKAAYKDVPDGFAGYGYDGLNILVEGLKQAGEDPTKLGDSLNKVNYVGVTGEFKFTPEDHTGLSSDSMIMVQVKGGKYQLIK
jgi:branched-chain amino acid transport system substrate-binding protein